MEMAARKKGKAIEIGFKCFGCCTWTKINIRIPGIFGKAFRFIKDEDSGAIILPGAMICNTCAASFLPGYEEPKETDVAALVFSEETDADIAEETDSAFPEGEETGKAENPTESSKPGPKKSIPLPQV